MHVDNPVVGPDEFSPPRQLDRDSTSACPSDFREEREELERVLSDPGISRSANLVRFLSFICNKYFDGKTNEIRERSIAIDALGRKESSFDSNIDPIVRVTARELRRKLGGFYKEAGKSHRLEIVLPLGHYVPLFVRRSDPETKTSVDSESVKDAAKIDSPLEQPSVSSDPIEIVHDENPQVSSTVFAGSINWRVVRKSAAIGISLLIVFLAGFFFGRHGEEYTAATSEPIKWGEPVWSDDFDGPINQIPDSSKWTYDVGNQDGWGNHELETYCAPKGDSSKECDPRRPNAFLDGSGHLVLRAEKNATGAWTSARITTRSLKNFQYGRIEARMKLPVGAGLWPSFWMLGANFPTAGWPASGSLDLVENVSVTPRSDGLGPTMIRSTLHGPRYSGGNGLWRDFKLPNGGRVDDSSFHTYGIIWSPDMIQFYVDDPANIFFVQYASDIPQGGQWVFDHPFFLVMNLAVGGDWPGSPDNTTPNPAELLVDYVRVYKLPAVSAPSIQWQPVRVKAGSAAASIITLRARNNAGHVYLSCSTEPATAVCALATPVVDFSDTLTQEDSLTISTDSFTEKGKVVAPPGNYKLTITATTISGDRSQLTLPFVVTGGS